MKWSEYSIAAYLSRFTFKREHLIVVPNCGWTGHECDLLVIKKNLMIIDVEIKISYGDLKNDPLKDKWYRAWDWKIDGIWSKDNPRRKRDWPTKVWKHYYCLPKEIWKPELFDVLPVNSGILFMTHNGNGNINITLGRPAKPHRDAEPISAGDAIDIARLASLRMWNAYDRAYGA